MAKLFARKFDIISPVWFQIVKDGDEYKIAGAHDVDVNWMRELRSKGKKERGTTLKGEYMKYYLLIRTIKNNK